VGGFDCNNGAYADSHPSTPFSITRYALPVAGPAGNRTQASSSGGPGVSSARYAFGPRVSTAGITGSLIRPFARGFAVFRLPFVGFLLLTACSCHDPTRPDGEVRTVTARDLVRQYRDDPAAARIAFTDQTVRVLVPSADFEGSAVLWRFTYDDPRKPAAITFLFDSRPAFTAPGWIEGTCLGRADDGKDRGPPGYTFGVTVSGCRVVPGP
jgi:hypothetical protein